MGDKLEKQGDQFVAGASEIYGLLGSVRADINPNNPNWNSAWQWVQIRGDGFVPVGGKVLQKGYGGQKLELLYERLVTFEKVMSNELRLLQRSTVLSDGSRQVPIQ